MPALTHCVGAHGENLIYDGPKSMSAGGFQTVAPEIHCLLILHDSGNAHNRYMKCTAFRTPLERA